MKTKQKQNEETLKLPCFLAEKCGFTDEPVALMAVNHVCIIHKAELTVLELASIIDSLSRLAGDMTVQLAAAAGMCDGCGKPEGRTPNQCVEECNICKDICDDHQEICIPAYLLEEAGIPADAKLEAYADGDTNAITVAESDIDTQQDITSLPSGVLNILKTAGVCLAELDELIIQGVIVHGK